MSGGQRECFNSFLFAALRSYHELSGLKRHKFILLAFWRSEVENGSVGDIPSGGSRESLFLVFSSFWRPALEDIILSTTVGS